MSLDVYLTVRGLVIQENTPSIFIRRNGRQEEISREEWDAFVVQ